MVRKTTWLPLLIAGCLALGAETWTPDALAAGASVDDANPKQKFDATHRYRKGSGALKRGKLEQALGHFRASYDIVASPNSHLMIARVMIKMGKLVEAYRELDLVIAEAEAARDQKKYGKAADAARGEQEALSPKLAFLIIETGVTAKLDDKPIPPEQWGKPIPMEPGTFEVVLGSKAGGEKRQQVTLEVGKRTTLSPPEPEPDAAPAPATTGDGPAPVVIAPAPGVSYQTLGYVAGGVGLAGLATFTIFGLVNNSTHSDLEAECTANRCPERLAETAESGRTYQTLANVGLGVGIVGLGTATVLLLMGSSRGSAEITTASTTPRLVVGPGSVSVAGGF